MGNADPKNKICPICNSGDIKTNVGCADNIWPEKHYFCYCHNCGLYFLEEKPSAADVEKYYKTSYYRLPFFMSAIKNIFRDFRCASQAAYLNELIPGPIADRRILEVGANDGRLLRYFSRKNSAIGLEYSDKSREFARKKYGIKLSDSDISEVKDRFDLVLLSHVFEHFLDMESVLSKIREILNDGGYVFLETTNSPRFDNCAEWDDKYLSGELSHIYNFSVKSLKLLADKHKFRIVSLDRFYYNLPSNYGMARKSALGSILMGVSPVKLAYSFDIAGYFLRSVFRPHLSYAKIRLDEQYIGVGDSIRMIISK